MKYWHIQQNGLISKILCSVKEAWHKRAHTVQFHLCVVEQAKLFHGRKKSEQSLLLGDKSGDKMKRYEKLSGLTIIVCIFIGVCVTQMFAFIKTYWIVQLRFGHFIEFKFTRTRTLSQYWTLGNDRYAEVFRVKCPNTCYFTLKYIKKKKRG